MKLRVLSWNVGIGDGSAVCPKSWYWWLFNKVIKSGNYDIILLQEVPNCVNREKKVHMGSPATKAAWERYWQDYNIYEYPRKPDGYGNLVVMSKKELNATDPKPRYKKGYEVFAITTKNYTFSISCIHFNRNTMIRAIQASRLLDLKFNNSKLNISEKAIVAGDFNAKTSEVSALLPGFKVSVPSLPDQIDHVTCLGFSSVVAIDVLVDRGVFSNVYDMPAGGHYPVAAEISLDEESPEEDSPEEDSPEDESPEDESPEDESQEDESPEDGEVRREQP